MKNLRKYMLTVIILTPCLNAWPENTDLPNIGYAVAKQNEINLKDPSSHDVLIKDLEINNSITINYIITTWLKAITIPKATTINNASLTYKDINYTAAVAEISRANKEVSIIKVQYNNDKLTILDFWPIEVSSKDKIDSIIDKEINAFKLMWDIACKTKDQLTSANTCMDIIRKNDNASLSDIIVVNECINAKGNDELKRKTKFAMLNIYLKPTVPTYVKRYALRYYQGTIILDKDIENIEGAKYAAMIIRAFNEYMESKNRDEEYELGMLMGLYNLISKDTNINDENKGIMIKCINKRKEEIDKDTNAHAYIKKLTDDILAKYKK